LLTPWIIFNLVFNMGYFSKGITNKSFTQTAPNY